MPHDVSTVTNRPPRARSERRGPVLGLAVLWSRAEPDRLGEVALPDPDQPGPWVLGRAPRPGSRALGLVRPRPGYHFATAPLRAISISREQWRLHVHRDLLLVENIGRPALLHNGVATSCARARVGDRLEIENELLVLVVARPLALPAERLPPGLVPAFGAADSFGIIGESAAAWELRRQLAFAAGRDDHVLLHGGSGSGKELAARAIHGLSRRADQRLVARNAATLPEGLIDAELFGNPRDYPNPGMPERPGLVGAADGSTLLLDEIGELAHTLQAHLLRVIDGGEYHRLGEARARRADVRIVAATNREPRALKHDLLARLRLRVQLPDLAARREDIPLLARHALRTLAADDPVVAACVFPHGDVNGEPAWSVEFVESLVTADYPTNVRELHARLWDAIAHAGPDGLTTDRGAAQGAFVDGDAGEPAETGEHPPAVPTAIAGDGSGGTAVDPRSLSAAEIRAALDACGGSRDRAWRALGLRNRHQLVRLMRRHAVGGARTTGPIEQVA